LVKIKIPESEPTKCRLAEPRTELKHASLYEAHLRGADLSYSDLADANLVKADLSSTNLTGTDLSHADLRDANLNASDVRDANLLGAAFEPSSMTGVNGFESAANPESVTYRSSPPGLVRLRKQFQDEGFRQQERKVTCALNRRQAQLAPFPKRWFKTVAFDLTCQYGMSSGRPLTFVALLWALFSLLYMLIVHKRRWMHLSVTHTLYNKWKCPPRDVQCAKCPCPYGFLLLPSDFCTMHFALLLLRAG